MNILNIYTDGSCSGNPGPGGYAAVCMENGKKKYVAGSVKHGTNNEMELRAAVEAVKAVKIQSEIVIHTDSKYLISCWAHTTEWLTSESRPHKDLWMQLISLAEKGKHKISFVKVAGHSGNSMNDLADRLAKEQVVKVRHELFG